MEIINNISKENKIPKKYFIKDKEIIYLADFEIDIYVLKTKKIKYGKTTREYKWREATYKIVFKDELFSYNRNELERIYFEKDFAKRYKERGNKGKPTISRIILKKELSYRN